jgi:hypothetical protein
MSSVAGTQWCAGNRCWYSKATGMVMRRRPASRPAGSPDDPYILVSLLGINAVAVEQIMDDLGWVLVREQGVQHTGASGIELPIPAGAFIQQNQAVVGVGGRDIRAQFQRHCSSGGRGRLDGVQLALGASSCHRLFFHCCFWSLADHS